MVNHYRLDKAVSPRLLPTQWACLGLIFIISSAAWQTCTCIVPGYSKETSRKDGLSSINDT